MALPRLAAFKSNYNGKYLIYISEDDEVIPNYLRYRSDTLTSSGTKFELEPANNGEDGVFNIRCCYNNKYWRAEKASNGLTYVLAAASEPNENQSDLLCTLFRIEYESSAHVIVHVNIGQRVGNDFVSDDDHSDCLQVSSDCQHTIIDWEALVLLPKFIVFKGDNAKYLQSHEQDGHEYLQYSSSDSSSSAVGNEVFNVGDGNVRIKSKGWGKFWKSNPNWIWANSTDTSNNDKSTLFTPIKVSNNVIALRNLGMNCFCRRFSLDYKENCICANETTISQSSEIEIGEYVASRTIYNVRFRLSHSRIYGETIEIAATQETSNSTSGTITKGLNLNYIDEVATTWSSTLEMKLGFSLEFSAGIPLITSATVKVSGEFMGSYGWGETLTTTTNKKSTYKAVVRPNTWVRVNLVATKGYCDVPFSYTQRDVYDDGSVKIEERDDGLYTGINCYNYNYEVEEKPL